MLKSAVLDILKTLDKQELKRFEDFVQSPYFNRKSVVIKLFKILKKYYPEFKSDDLNREVLWNLLYPGKEFNYGVMKNLIYELTKLSEYFLQSQNFESDSFKRQLYLLENLSGRSNKKLFTSRFKALEEELNNKESFNFDTYRNLKDLSVINYNFHFSNVGVSKDKDLAYKISEYEIYSFIVECLKNFNNNATFSLRNNEIKDFDIVKDLLRNFPLEKLLGNIRKNSEHDFIILNTYYKMFLATKNIKTPEYYFLYKSFLIENDHLFNDSEKRLLYNFLEAALTLNYTIENRNKEYFEIDKLRFDRKIILNKEGIISFNEFTAIARTAADLREVKFLENFIRFHLKNVPTPVREKADCFSNAYLFYVKGDFDRSLELINSNDMNSTEFRINLRLLKLKILYDKNDLLSLEYLIDSFRHYLSKDIIPETYRTSYLNFCKYLTRLFKLREAKDHTSLNIIRSEILRDETANKSWLLEKIDELPK